MANGFDIFKYKDQLDRERAEREARYGKKNTIGMKLTRCSVFAVCGIMVWSLSTTFNMPSTAQAILNGVLLGVVLHLCYRVFKPKQHKR